MKKMIWHLILRVAVIKVVRNVAKFHTISQSN